MRWIYLPVLCLFLGGGSLAIDAKDFKTAYDLLRNGLCSLKITCLLPKDMIYPADWQNDVEARLSRSREVLLIGDVQSLQPVIGYLDGWLRTSDPTRKQNRPQIFAVVPPMSKLSTFASPRCRATWAEKMAPPAGPLSTRRIGKRAAVSMVVSPPPESIRTTSVPARYSPSQAATRMEIPASRSDPNWRSRGRSLSRTGGTWDHRLKHVKHGDTAP